MLWCRLVFLSVLSALIASCGFTPAYKIKDEPSRESMKARLAAIEVMPVSGRMGQELRNTLQDTLSPETMDGAAEYRLYVTLKKNIIPAAIEKDRRITRYNIIIAASYSLKSIAQGTMIDSGTVKVVASYDSLDSRFSTFVAEDKTTSNAIHELAEQLTTRLMTTALIQH